MFKWKLFLMGLSLTSLCGCGSTPLTMDQIARIEKGLSVNMFIARINNKPKEEVTINYQNHQYTALFYNMQTGTRTITTTTCNQYGCYPIPVIVPILSPYVFLFDQRSFLFTWGFTEELNTSNDPLIIDLMGLAQPVQN